MPEGQPNNNFIFPRWSNYLLPIMVLGVIGAGLYLPVLVTFGWSAKTLNVNYAPPQPVPYSHALHVGRLGMDCRYCHTTVDKAAFAALPPTQTCINCHNPTENQNGVRKQSAKLAIVHDSYRSGKPIEWVKVHNLPDFVFFNHSAHVSKGVSCVSCHGRVDRMEVVATVKPLSMSWCLDCHRAPEKHLRPVAEVYNLAWAAKPQDGETAAQAQLRIGLEQKSKLDIHDPTYMTSCSTCHR